MKVCRGPCGKELPEGDFNRKSSSPDGYDRQCRACHQASRGRKLGGLRTCADKDCGREFFAKDKSQTMCSVACGRGRPQPGEQNANWNGGETTSPKGYVYVKRPEHPRAMKNGYVKRADLVLEGVIGRPLTDGEEAHHKNRVRDDDSPGNLELHTKESHAALHAAERRKPKPPKEPPKRVAWPPIDELTARVKAAGSLRTVAKEIGCSHVMLYRKLNAAKA